MTTYYGARLPKDNSAGKTQQVNLCIFDKSMVNLHRASEEPAPGSQIPGRVLRWVTPAITLELAPTHMDIVRRGRLVVWRVPPATGARGID